jgi:enterochelin esterase-like enzyme
MGQMLKIDTVRMQKSHVKSGTLRTFQASKNGSARNVDIWLPEHYSSQQKYDVVYMHDGQMLFDSTLTWNHQEWKVDEVSEDLMHDGKVKPFIVVGIWNDPANRYAEFFPEAIYSDLDTVFAAFYYRNLWNEKLRADSYLKWIVDTLIPSVQQEVSCKEGQNHTFMMGSSMGAVISLYGMCEYPKVFGGVACLSFHGPMVNSNMLQEDHLNKIMIPFINYLKVKLPSQHDHFIYLDRGGKDLDSWYPPYHKLLLKYLSKKYNSSHLTSRVFEESGHNEKDWSKRLAIPLSFLLR